MFKTSNGAISIQIKHGQRSWSTDANGMWETQKTTSWSSLVSRRLSLLRTTQKTQTCSAHSLTIRMT
jgi:hypothetical protein